MNNQMCEAPRVGAEANIEEALIFVVCSVYDDFTDSQRSLLGDVSARLDSFLRMQAIGRVKVVEFDAKGSCLFEIAIHDTLSDLAMRVFVDLINVYDIDESNGFYRHTGGDDFLEKCRRPLLKRACKPSGALH